MKKAKSLPSTAKKQSDESPAVEALTVSWVLTILLTLVFDVGTLASGWYVTRVDPHAKPIAALYALSFFGAILTGFICVILTLVVKRLRSAPAPAGVTWFALAVSLMPLVLICWQLLI